MKKSILIAFSVIFLCVLMLQATLASAAYAGCEISNYLDSNGVTEDGKWTNAAEWTDAATATGLPAGVVIREKWTYPDTTRIIVHTLVEFFTDSTNDTGDYFQFCFDPQANGGSAPQTDDFLINYTGNRRSGLTVYKGTGSGWAAWSSYTYGSELVVAETKTGSPLNSADHFVFELMMDRTKAEWDASGAGYLPDIRVAVYDASNAAAGVQSWPPTSANTPGTWALETGVYGAIPESSTILTVLLLSAVAVAVGFYSLRKRPKTEIRSTGKIGEIN